MTKKPEPGEFVYYIRILAERYLFDMLTGRPHLTDGSSIETDKRRRKKVLRTLLKEGYIDESNTREEAYASTKKAYDEIEALDPCIKFDSSRYKAEVVPGVEWNQLNLEQHKWIYDNQDKYLFFAADSYRDNIVHGPFKLTPENWDRYLGIGTRNTLCIATTEFIEARKAYGFDKRFKELTGQHLNWGLVQLGLLKPEDKDVFKTFDRNGRFLHSYFGLGTDPAKWEEECRACIVELRKNIEANQRRLRVLAEVDHAVDCEYRGWASVIEKYKAALLEALKKEEEEEEADEPAPNATND